jgi:hypothetical protein
VTYLRFRPRSIYSRHHLIGVAALAAIVVSGCGGNDAKIGSRSITEQTRANQSTTTAGATSASGELGGGEADDQITNFSTPSGNIVCWATNPAESDGSLVCAVLSTKRGPHGYPRVWYLPVSGKVTVWRYSLGRRPALRHRVAYGSVWQQGYFRCVSRFKGLTCSSDNSQRGFFLSRQSQEILVLQTSSNRTSPTNPTPASSGPFIEEGVFQNWIEDQTVRGEEVDSADCVGLKQYGSRTLPQQDAAYRRYRCQIYTSNHIWFAWIRITNSDGDPYGYFKARIYKLQNDVVTLP